MTDQEAVQEPVAEVHQEAAPQEQQNDKEINFKAVREANELLKRQNEYLQMQLMQKEQQPQQQHSDPDLNSFKDDDIPTYGELKRIFEKEKRERSQYLEKIKDLEMKASYQDYAEVINKYLPDVLQNDPDLAMAIKDNPQMHKLAYKLAQASPRYHQEKLAKQNISAMNKMAENASRPQPASARKNVAMQSEDSTLASMSDSDIMRVFNMAKARS